jgi:hypothetical protein
MMDPGDIEFPLMPEQLRMEIGAHDLAAPCPLPRGCDAPWPRSCRMPVTCQETSTFGLSVRMANAF